MFRVRLAVERIKTCTEMMDIGRWYGDHGFLGGVKFECSIEPQSATFLRVAIRF